MIKASCTLPILIFMAGLLFAVTTGHAAEKQPYAIVDTGQKYCCNTSRPISFPEPGQPFCGQDAQYAGPRPRYRDNGDGTVTDLNTGLMWQKTPNLKEKSTFREALAGADTCRIGGYEDWRLPTIKELYSLIDFRGYSMPSSSRSVPYINTDYFEFVYGDRPGGRVIDAQYWSSTQYVGTTMHGAATVFGVNFADGRIKGYPRDRARRGERPTHFVRYVRGNPDYGKNDFVDNGDGTVTDRATGLTWMKADSGREMDWRQALAYAENLTHAGYSDWRLPNAKELQSIVDYTRAPDAREQSDRGPAIDPIFDVTETESWYWTGTSHLEHGRFSAAVYVCFGRAWGTMRGRRMNVHGAGAQRSAPKTGDPDRWPNGRGPQGDEIRIYNYVRCVRGGNVSKFTESPQIDETKYPYNLAAYAPPDQRSSGLPPRGAENAPAGGRFQGPPLGQGRSGGQQGGRGMPPGGFDGFLRRFDRNSDGKVSKDEAPPPMERRWRRVDTDRNGYVDRAEWRTTVEERGQGGGAGRAGSPQRQRRAPVPGRANSSDQKMGLITRDDAAFEGYTLVAALPTESTYLLDMEGRVVHSWGSQFRPGQTAYLLENGHLLRAGHMRDAPGRWSRVGGAGGAVQEFTWDGDLVWDCRYATDEHLQHHDIERLPNGNVLLIAWEKKTKEEAIEAGRDPSLLSDGELWPDSVVEVKPTGKTTGEVVWEWHLWDHLVQDFDPSKENHGDVTEHPELVDINYISGPSPEAGGADWTHVNSVDYNPKLDQILLSVRGMGEIWVIDHSTTTQEAAGHSGGRSGKGGDILYRWGNPQVYGTGEPDKQVFYGQHDASWIEPGKPGADNILVFNNGSGRSAGRYSSVVEIAPPVGDDGSYGDPTGSAYGPAEPVWAYTASPKNEFFSTNISGAQRLPNGNTLVCSGQTGRLFEVTRECEIVWEYMSPISLQGRPGGPAAGPPGAGRREGGGQGRPRPPAGGAGGRPSSPRSARGGPGGTRNSVPRVLRYAPDYEGLADRDLEPGELLVEVVTSSRDQRTGQKP